MYKRQALLSEYPEYRPVHRALTERQIMLYRALIEIGAGTGEFVLASPPGMIARNLVALEDAYDLYPLAGDPTPVSYTHLSSAPEKTAATTSL